MNQEIPLTPNAREVLEKRYLLKNNEQQIIETAAELFQRVARHVAQAEKNFKSVFSAAEVEENFYEGMKRLEFLPNSPTLMNAGTNMGQLSACFVVPVEDSIEGIFEAVKKMAHIHQSGGGTGFSFSNLRPKGDLVASTKGQASGPVSFMQVFDEATGVIVQGGRRRGANMGILRCDHPDILEFIEAKHQKNRFANFNLSVGATDDFMKAVLKNQSYDLRHPNTRKPVKRLKAKSVFDWIVQAAWRTGDPGLVFLDEINRHNPTPLLGAIEATNPCGELPLLAYESCNLGSVNLSKMVKDRQVDWQKLGETVRWGIRFLDDVIEMNRYPFAEIEKVTLANRKIGLGVMGFADMLIQLGIPYHSQKAVRFAGRLMRFIRGESLKASAELAAERGVFPNYPFSIYVKKNLKLRNATVNSIAPTGTISIIAGCSSGIEPLFAVSFVRTVLSGTELYEIHPLFEEMARALGVDSKKIFITAFDVTPHEHLAIQAAFQQWTDNAVSKTINLPHEATEKDVRNIYLEAYRLRCKGITVYRYGSKKGQVLSFP